MGKKVPDRWLNYSKIGGVVAGTSFIPFKVPLHQNICENLPETERHTTHDIVEALPNVGLVINLTNTQKISKYYNPNDWTSKGIDYKWIKVEGHVTPAQHLLVRFCQTVKQFMLANPSKLIGIHCTHGLNRTGYFVCSYMVLVLSIPPDEAMKRFSEARGYDIERENYIDSIKLHDSNISLKQAANTLSNIQVNASKRHNETEIDKARYDDRNRRNIYHGDDSKSNRDYSRRDKRDYSSSYKSNFHGSSSRDDKRSWHKTDGRFSRMHDVRDEQSSSYWSRGDFRRNREYSTMTGQGGNWRDESRSRDRHPRNNERPRTNDRYSWRRNHSPLRDMSRSKRRDNRSDQR